MPEPMSLLLADFGTISPSFDALSDHLLQNFTGRETPKAVQLASLTVEVRLSPYEALQGVMVPLGIPVFMRCAVCGGSGRDWYTLCLSCQGQGMVETEHTVHVRLHHRGCGRARWWRYRYTSWGFTMSLCVCTSG